MKKKSDQKVRVTYEQVGSGAADLQRRAEAAFDVLFEEIFAPPSENANFQHKDSKTLNEHLFSKTRVSGIGC